MKRLVQRLSWTFALTLALPPSAQAVDRTWTNAGIAHDSQWSTLQNWSGNMEPTGSDNVIFPSSVPFTLFFITLSNGENASSLTLNNFYHLQGGSLTLATGSVTVASGF